MISETHTRGRSVGPGRHGAGGRRGKNDQCSGCGGTRAFAHVWLRTVGPDSETVLEAREVGWLTLARLGRRIDSRARRSEHQVWNAGERQQPGGVARDEISTHTEPDVMTCRGCRRPNAADDVCSLVAIAVSPRLASLKITDSADTTLSSVPPQATLRGFFCFWCGRRPGLSKVPRLRQSGPSRYSGPGLYLARS